MKNAISRAIMACLAIGLCFGIATAQPPIPAQEQPEVLTRGPVHEAFSEPVIMQDQDRLIIPNQPPADIEEVPPTDRPEGDQYVWVPGYWSWDGDRNNFIWVSGCWRAAPPNMSWVPGYWNQVRDGWEWVAGFWTPVENQDFEYLPAPTASYDPNPPGASPSQDDIWVPPCQYWYQNHYVDRPGYWLQANPDWVWTPSHYVWTPRGYIFCDGHWDYPLADRGVLFAPVYFPRSVYQRPDYRYSPSIVIDLGVLSINLFSYPRYSHYYFGDYYDDSYRSMGIFPRYEVDRIHTWYDPTYSYDRWHHRDDPRWGETQQHDYDTRHADKDLRPPRTYHEMEVRQAASSTEQQRTTIRIAAPLTVVVARKDAPIKFAHVDAQTQQTISKQTTAVHEFRTERNRLESAPVVKQADQSSPQQKGHVTPPAAERNNPAGTAEQRGRVTTPIQHNAPATTTEPKGRVTTPAGNREQTAQPRATNAQMAPKHEVRATQAERVKAPAPAIVGRQTATLKSPPARPDNERKYTGAAKTTAKDAPKKVQQPAKANGKSKDKPGDKGGDKNNDKGK